MMNLSKSILFIFICSIISIKLINCSEDDYDYELSDQLSMNNSISLNDSLAINGTDDDYYEYDDEDEDECTVDTFIDHYTELLLPEDYEEGKQLDFTQKSYTFSESIARVKRLHQYQQNVSRKVEPILKRIMPRLSEMLFYIDLPSDCMASLARIGQAARNGERWALKFMDSMPSGKVFSLQINSLPFGEYDECLSIESPDTEDKEKPKIFGHYCSLGLPTNILPSANPDHIEDNKRIDEIYSRKLKEYLNGTDQKNVELKFIRQQIQDRYDGKFLYGLLQYIDYLGTDKVRLPSGLCLPSTCDPKDIEYALNKILFPMTRFNMIINSDCDYKDKPVQIDKYQIISLFSIVLITLVCVISTLIYLLRNKDSPKSSIDGQSESTIFKITDCFSIIPNFKAIFDTTERIEKFTAMEGIRAILCFWMFMQHEYESGFLPIYTKKARQSAPYKFSYQLRYILFVNWNLTDTFFLMGGFMTCYILLSKLEKSRGKFNYIQYGLYRYLRMLPIILVGIAITFVIELIGDGPLWPLTSYIIQRPCVDNYLPTILMMNNYVGWPDIVMCLPISWYSAADFQLHLMAPIIILVLFYSPKVGIIWNVVVIILGSFIALAPKLWFGIPHLFDSYKSLDFDLMTKTVSHHYWGVEAHVQLYFVGILVGYLIRRHPNVYLGGRWGELGIWLTTWAMTFYAIFWHRNYYNLAEYRVTESEVINWIAFSKVCYAAGWCWAFYACTTGRGGFINKFFGWNGFKPFAYLMLEIYILHLFIIIYRVGTTREHIFYSDYYVWTVMIFDYILTCCLAIIVNVLVTKPFANLLDLFMKRNKRVILDENNDILKFNKKGKLGSEDNNNVNNDIIILKNVAFDDSIPVIIEKPLINDNFDQNLDNNSNITNDINNNTKDITLKM